MPEKINLVEKFNMWAWWCEARGNLQSILTILAVCTFKCDALGSFYIVLLLWACVSLWFSTAKCSAKRRWLGRHKNSLVSFIFGKQVLFSIHLSAIMKDETITGSYCKNSCFLVWAWVQWLLISCQVLMQRAKLYWCCMTIITLIFLLHIQTQFLHMYQAFYSVKAKLT